MAIWNFITQRKSVLFLIFTLLGAAFVFLYIYLVGFSPPAERGSLWLPKLILFLILLISLIIRFQLDKRKS